MTCNPDNAEGAWVVENVATVPDFRRMGIVSRLLDEMVKRGRSRGHELAQISYLIGNSPALRAYEKAGFKLVNEKRHPDFEAAMGCPGVGTLLK